MFHPNRYCRTSAASHGYYDVIHWLGWDMPASWCFAIDCFQQAHWTNLKQCKATEKFSPREIVSTIGSIESGLSLWFTKTSDSLLKKCCSKNCAHVLSRSLYTICSNCYNESCVFVFHATLPLHTSVCVCYKLLVVFIALNYPCSVTLPFYNETTFVNVNIVRWLCTFSSGVHIFCFRYLVPNIFDIQKCVICTWPKS